MAMKQTKRISVEWFDKNDKTLIVDIQHSALVSTRAMLTRAEARDLSRQIRELVGDEAPQKRTAAVRKAPARRPDAKANPVRRKLP